MKYTTTGGDRVESNLVRIIRGLPVNFETLVCTELANCLEATAKGWTVSWNKLIDYLEAASQLMIPLPEYDVSDFDAEELTSAIALLVGGNPEIWGQLLHALDDRHSGLFDRLKALSPFAGEYLMFLDVTGSTTTLKAELDDQLAARLMQLADAHDFPGNCYVIVVPPEAIDKMSFVDGVDIAPTTA